MNILYVEDDPNDAHLTQRFLADHAPNIQIDVVEDQTQAEARLLKNHYDLVLADLKLLQGDGLSLLASIRARDLPLAVVIITGRGDEESVVAALRAGADDYVIKRHDYLTQLPQTLNDALHRFLHNTARKKSLIRVLYAEHNQADIDLAQRHFQKVAPHINMESVSLGSSVLKRLTGSDGDKYDLLLLDYRLPGMNALELLKDIRQAKGLDIPVILTTGHGDEEVALQALKLGAYDYVVKSEGYLYRLPAALENAIYQTRLAKEEARYRSLFETVPVGLYRNTLEGQCIDANPALVDMLRYPSLEALKAVNMNETYVNSQDRQTLINQLKTNGEVIGFIAELKCRENTSLWAEIDVKPIRNNMGELVFLQGAMKDITERVRVEKALKQLNEELEERVNQRTGDLNILVESMTGRELRMAELKKVIKNLRAQIEDAGMTPIDDDPLAKYMT